MTTRKPSPDHYSIGDQIEPWDYIESQGLDFWAGNVIKYITRAGRKHGATVLRDLEKARNYIDYMMERAEKEVADKADKPDMPQCSHCSALMGDEHEQGCRYGSEQALNEWRRQTDLDLMKRRMTGY